MESLSHQPVFLRLFKTTLARAINFKPSVHASLYEDIDDLVLECLGEKRGKNQLRKTAMLDESGVDGDDYGTGKISDLVAQELVINSDADDDDEDDESQSEVSNDDDDNDPEDAVEDISNKIHTESYLDKLTTSMTSSATMPNNIITIVEKMILMDEDIRANDTFIMQQLLKTKVQRELGKSLMPSVLKYKKAIKGYVDSDRTNHERHKYLLELLFAVYEYAQEDKVFESIWETNQFLMMLHDMLDNQLRLCTEPFNRLNGDGVILDLWQNFPNMVNLISLGRKPKIVRACIFLQSQMIYLKDNFPELLIHQADYATILNEVMIEHHHSAMQRVLKDLSIKFQTIRNESIHICQKRSSNKIFRTLLELEGALRKKSNKRSGSRIDGEAAKKIRKIKKSYENVNSDGEDVVKVDDESEDVEDYFDEAEEEYDRDLEDSSRNDYISMSAEPRNYSIYIY